MKPLRLIPPAIILGICFALAHVATGFFVYKGIVKAKMTERYVVAKGLIERLEKSDRANWKIHFKVSGNDISVLSEKLSHTSELVQDFLIKGGVEKKEISLGLPRITDLREYTSSPPPERYSISYYIEVNSRKVDVLASLSRKTADLINKGVGITDSNLYYYLDKFNDLRPELIADATKNALQVAKSFSETTGSHIGGIRKANQGTIQILSPDASPDDQYNVGADSLMKKIRVVSTLEFYVQ